MKGRERDCPTNGSVGPVRGRTQALLGHQCKTGILSCQPAKSRRLLNEADLRGLAIQLASKVS